MLFERIVFKHKTPIQIRFNDVDIIGHVNNAVYQNYFDLARLQYFQEVLGEGINWKMTGLVMVSITINYFEPILLGESVSGLSKVTRIGNKSIEMLQKIDGDDGELKAQNRAVMVAYDYDSKASVKVSKEWREKIFKFDEYPHSSLRNSLSEIEGTM